MHIEINTDTLTTSGVTKLAKQLSRIAELNDKRNEAVRAIEPIDSVPADPKRGRKPRAAKAPKPVRAPRKANHDKPSIVSPGPKPRKARERKAAIPPIPTAGAPDAATPTAPNPVTGRTRKERPARQTSEKRQRPCPESTLAAARAALASGNHDSESITSASKLTKPNALFALGRLVEAGEVTKTGTTKDARWTLVKAAATDAGDE